ncbi:NaeI family type II restriction endonuclease [Altererythrobacter aquiaggeris]|uniref:NaeI family type II restriction endonuclease n=1 Tax=Aestuarierythrobacter aquiaggeris TaxID=1898396 RepID=UPI003016567C
MTHLGGIQRFPVAAEHQDFDHLQKLESDLLEAVGGWQAFEEKLRGFFRSAIDEVIDTARTGRFFFSDLEKTEKTYLGTKFEIILRDWLGVPKGVKLDLLIGGEEVDVKTSTSAARGGWMIPPEAFEQLCILIKVNELKARCDFGLVRARSDYLRSSSNRDSKTGLSASGMANIWWMAKDFGYTPNFWSLTTADDRTAIMTGGGKRRLATLFERFQGVGISRIQIEAVASQDDFMKRLRKNGGARDLLSPKNIAVLYSEIDAPVMRELGIAFGSREFVSYQAKTSAEIALLKSAGHLD